MLETYSHLFHFRQEQQGAVRDFVVAFVAINTGTTTAATIPPIKMIIAITHIDIYQDEYL